MEKMTDDEDAEEEFCTLLNVRENYCFSRIRIATVPANTRCGLCLRSCPGTSGTLRTTVRDWSFLYGGRVYPGNAILSVGEEDVAHMHTQ